ncbi:hypothetical protein FRC02_001774 [Tulasnella sp. 418]|nr:hypothetical protein FRC02_001774 [Tulasnella sp. 418]
MKLSTLFGAVLYFIPLAVEAATTWKNVKIGGGGGFVPGIVFSEAQKGVAFARTDIGGLYRLNADDSWTPLLDWADHTHWNYWGVDALALDPTDAKKLYIAVGMYTTSWDPNNGSILKSSDSGNTWSVASTLPFKVGGNMPGRGMGERLAVDPNKPSVLFFGARSGNGLYKSTDSGTTWTKVTTFPSAGTYVQDPSNEYSADIVGLSWITFDKTSGTSGNATPRIFVGVANLGSNNVFVSEDGGSTWSAVAGQTNTYIPHRGVISPSDKTLYITYGNGAGPYDGTLGSVWKYKIDTKVWTDITPQKNDLYFGFGGLGVDLQKPGTIMVATVNSWWPDGQIFRSTDGGATWSVLWAFDPYPTLKRYYTYDASLAPWITVGAADDDKEVGWMMESLSIDPFDSNHWLYGTGLTIYGGRDLTKWDTSHMITLKSLADGIEEFAVQGLISPPVGPNLLSAIGDVGGFAHTSLTSAPATPFINPQWATALDIDYAGNKPTNIVRIGSDTAGATKQVALSTDSGATWNQDYGAPDGVAGGKVALSADGDVVLWRTGSNGVMVSRYTNAFTAVSSLPSNAAIASDKLTNANFYGASANQFYVSTDFGVTFTAKGTLGSSTYSNDIVVHPTVTGDVWVSTDKGLFHTTNTGTSFTTISGFTEAWSISVGAPKVAGGYPSIYVIGTYSGATGVYRSDDQGVNFVRLDDAAHRFGSASSNVISGDRRIYGRVYVGTNGRGIFYGDASGSDPTPTASSSSSRATSSTSSRVVSSSSSVRPSSTTSVRSSSSSSVRTTSSSVRSSSSSSTRTSTSTAAGATQTPYGQCGGSGYTGPTICPTGWTCKYSNDFYSQCLQ